MRPITSCLRWRSSTPESSASIPRPKPRARFLTRSPTMPQTPASCSAAGRCDRSTPTCARSEEHTSELQSPDQLVCRLLLDKKKNTRIGLANFYLTVDGHRRVRHRVGDCVWLPDRGQYSSAFFFCNDTATTEISTLSLHDALPI